MHEDTQFPKFDIHIGRHQLSLKGEVMQKDTKCCHYGLYGFLSVTIELDNAPFTL